VTDEDFESAPDEPAGQEWLVTWADMVSLLLVFFMVLQAFSTINEKKFADAMHSIQRAFRTPVAFEGGAPVPGEPEEMEEMERALADEDIEGISVQGFSNRLVVTVESGLLFDLGRAELRPDAAPVMDRVARALAAVDGSVRVEGHTCDLPVGAGSPFRDNWGLSSGRALTVVGALVERGIRPERLAAVGNGEFRPVAPNDGEENRRRNRRVEFVVEKRVGSSDNLEME
jgi:chemotaxis protein MotB